MSCDTVCSWLGKNWAAFYQTFAAWLITNAYNGEARPHNINQADK
ncbi:hypothetical protein HCH_06425 [Hahella chejuensis KCTC 2396]|uniref:Uncharacterized protein n=1 Tax=Hahella chejuensis (strain KCTC 2396) TaxID=349521 RepID=Q2S8F4_HAHCH|nr:hypothetical protein HCH_06425 [Hahella chejuensis KCTC 2396]